jgi:hypothetical protein
MDFCIFSPHDQDAADTTLAAWVFRRPDAYMIARL